MMMIAKPILVSKQEVQVKVESPPSLGEREVRPWFAKTAHFFPVVDNWEKLLLGLIRSVDWPRILVFIVVAGFI